MALLQYKCEDCGERFTELVSFNDKNNIKCTGCGSDRVNRAYEGSCLFGSISSNNSRFEGCPGACPGCDHNH